jgi:hypothetical protein
MKIILDTEVMKKRGGIDQMLYLLSLFSGCPISVDTFESARQKNLLKFNQPYDRRFPMPKNLELSEPGKYIVESVLADCNNNNRSEERLKNLANSLRELFPAGIKPGYSYTWRDSESCIVDRLKKFFLKYGDNHTDEEIIDATKRYVASFNGNYQYMQLLKYFIWKNKVTGEKVERGRIVGEVERQSQLAAWLENTEDKSVNRDWDVALR